MSQTGDEATVLPEGFKCIGRSEKGCVVAIEHETKNLYGLQYHPEVTHSEKGMRTLKHFLFNIAKCERSWSMANVLEEQIQIVKEKVGETDHVICALSGGGGLVRRGDAGAQSYWRSFALLFRR